MPFFAPLKYAYGYVLITYNTSSLGLQKLYHLHA